MSWAHVHRYIVSLAPQITEGFLGVPEEHIAACENGLNLRLPPAYREFLLTMGVDAGGFYPLGRTMEWNFYEMLRDLPAEDYSPQEFFRIANQPNENYMRNDFYLNMRTVDECGDCEILMIEWLRPPRREEAIIPPQTFLELVTQVAWQTLDASRFSHRRRIFVSLDDADDLVERKAAVLEVLRRAGFRHTLPPTPRVDCLAVDGDQTATARVDLDEGLLTTFLASDSGATASRLMHLILDNVEDASV